MPAAFPSRTETSAISRRHWTERHAKLRCEHYNRNLVTRDAHGLYAQHGFVPVKHPERYMEKLDPEVYTKRKP